ncbi:MULTISPECIES: hypothetical protein [unclassified Synechococcus]|uniref:hypothetical protein n=1 Tax=unclassified Synechococcus TaxID=2626047 RepID=UPI0020CBEE82|nr:MULTISPECIES: hypothetical protein [unclassified Synechococcus]
MQDGPFPDTKEQLGGFFLIDVAGGGAGPLAAPTRGWWPGSRPAAGADGQAIALATATGAGEPLRLSPDTPVQ